MSGSDHPSFPSPSSPPPQVPLWSRIGRLKRQVYPKLTGGGHNFGGGASAGVMSAVAGRLLCDTYLIGGCDSRWLVVQGRWLVVQDSSIYRIGLSSEVYPTLSLPIHTPISARELVREVDYTLRTLSSALLGQAREDLAPSDVPRRYASPASVLPHDCTSTHSLRTARSCPHSYAASCDDPTDHLIFFCSSPPLPSKV